MIEWLKHLFHCHQWKIIDNGYIVNREDLKTGNWYDLQCSVCGKIKRKNTS